MTILTPKMKTARSDHYGSNVKLWYPCDDAGNIMAERIVGADITDLNTSEHDIPHAIGIGTAANLSVPNLADVHIPRRGMFMAVINVSVSYALINLYIGHTTGTHLNLAGAGVALNVSGGATVSGVTGATGPAAGQPILLACAWDTDNFYTYTGENAAATLRDTDTLSAALKNALPAAFSANAQVQSTGTEADYYGMALFDFTNDGLPNDLLTGINWMRSKWLAGHKELYEPWKTRS